MKREPDGELFDRFGALRDAERAVAPPYAAMVARLQARRVGPTPERRRRPVVAVMLALAAVLLLVILARPSRRGPAFWPTLADAGSWRGPTDFLLDLPGRDLWRTVPTFGWPEPWPAPYPTLRSRSESS